MLKATLLTALAGLAAAQDPADGWMAYAVGTIPSSATRITKLEMTWKVSANPTGSRDAFFSPWFGMDPDDNLNLIQPVNPWSGGAWSAYTEYFQWSPTHNSNSRQIGVEAGQTLHGLLEWNSVLDSYKMTQTVVETGATSTQTQRCQSGKKYRVPYVVYEKEFPCKDYPPDGKVDFKIVALECDGADCTAGTRWAPMVKGANCDMTAHINSPTDISITWDTSLPSRFDNWTRSELVYHNRHGWARNLLLNKYPVLDEFPDEVAVY